MAPLAQYRGVLDKLRVSPETLRKIHIFVALVLISTIPVFSYAQDSYRDAISVRVIDADYEQPLADAYVLVSSFTDKSIWVFHREPEVSPHALFRTGADGMFVIPKDISMRQHLRLTVWKPGYRYVWLSHIGLAVGKSFVVVSDPVRYQATGEPVSIIKLKSVDAAYLARDHKFDLEHFSNKLKSLGSDPLLVPWQRGITVPELRVILTGELGKLK